jgi:uncharacterized membrane protein
MEGKERMLEGTVAELYSKKRLFELFWLLALASAGCVMFLALRVLFTGSHIYLFLVWNLFLAWIPFMISLVLLRFGNPARGGSPAMSGAKGPARNGESGPAEAGAKSKAGNASKAGAPRKIVCLIIGFLWLLFYPNAPYILTDIVHLIRLGMYYPDMNELITANALIWYDIILNAAFSIMGHLIGLFSLLFVHRVFTGVFSRKTGWLVVAGACVLSGFGIYLGRFVRLNSTDLLVYPFISLREIVGNLLYIKAILFSLSVGFFIFITYISVYAFYRIHER